MTKRQALLALALLLLGATLIFSDRIVSHPVWIDESASIRLANDFSFVESIMRTARDVHPPFFYLLLKVWALGAGSTHIAARSFAVLANLAMLLMAYFFTLKLISFAPAPDRTGQEISHSRIVAILTVGYLAASCFVAQQAWSARMYGLGVLLFFVSSYSYLCVLDPLQTRVKFWLSALVAANLLSLLTHYFLGFSLLAQVLFTLWLWQARSTLSVDSARLRFLLQSYFVVGILFILWLPVVVDQFTRSQEDYWAAPLAYPDILSSFGQMAFPAGRTLEMSALTDWWVFIICFTALIAYLVQASKRGRWWEQYVVFAALVPVLLLFLLSHSGRSAFQARGLNFAWPFFLIALARVIVYSKNLLYIAGFGLLPFWALGYHTWTHIESFRHAQYPGTRGATQYIAEDLAKEDLVVVTNPLTYFGVEYYLRQMAPVLLVMGKAPADHWQGGAFLREGEWKRPQILENTTATRLWLVQSDGYKWKDTITLPDRWERISIRSFIEPYHFQGTITVEEYLNRGPAAALKSNILVPRAEEAPTEWRYTLTGPGVDWFLPEYDDSLWLEGQAAIGSPGLTKPLVRTLWKTQHIWMRHHFRIEGATSAPLSLWVSRDEYAEVYINGEHAVSTLVGWSFDSEEYCLSPKVLQTLQRGENSIAVYARNTVSTGHVEVSLREAVTCIPSTAID